MKMNERILKSVVPQGAFSIVDQRSVVGVVKWKEEKSIGRR